MRLRLTLEADVDLRSFVLVGDIMVQSFVSLSAATATNTS